jgi:ABC-type multidrug transport system fused ATPase/permease subunit
LCGGYLACLTSSTITPTDYIAGLQDGFNPVIVTVCAVKAVVYGFLITSICAYNGFYTEGGALEVGQSATRGVVYSCVMILFADLNDLKHAVMIETKDIYKTFGDNEVLKGISAQFKPGKNNLIIGGSGSGKTTLLKCIVGLHEPTKGHVIV